MGVANKKERSEIVLNAWRVVGMAYKRGSGSDKCVG